jgi:predicted Zn finger-like uncharacterized protein
MIVVCPACQSRYRFDETKMGGRPKVSLRCSKCSATIDIDNPQLAAGAAEAPPPAAPPRPGPAPKPAHPSASETNSTRETPVQHEVGESTMAATDAQRLGLLHLPKDKRFSLAVIQGAATGQIFPVHKTRTIIGRSGADINLDDPEASRQHAALEIVGEIALLRDLGSTNGTWIELERVDQRQLGNQQEFRIGSHVLMFIVTDVE